MSTRKDDLLGAALEYLVRNGAASVSLRPLAAALGTSARMLVFHFGSKERLLQEVMLELSSRLQRSLQAMSARSGQVPPLKLFWEWATAKENLPGLKLLYEVQIIATQNPSEYGRYLKKVSDDWHRTALAAMSESRRSSELATLCIAVFDGLFLELMAGGDHVRLTQALDRFVAMVSSGSAERDGVRHDERTDALAKPTRRRRYKRGKTSARRQDCGERCPWTRR